MNNVSCILAGKYISNQWFNIGLDLMVLLCVSRIKEYVCDTLKQKGSHVDYFVVTGCTCAQVQPVTTK